MESNFVWVRVITFMHDTYGGLGQFDQKPNKGGGWPTIVRSIEKIHDRMLIHHSIA